MRSCASAYGYPAVSVTRPEHGIGLLPDDGGLEGLDRFLQALAVARRAVLILDREDVVLADHPRARDEVVPPPLAVAVADRAEHPTSREDIAAALHVEVALNAGVDRVDLRVLGVDMENRALRA